MIRLTPEVRVISPEMRAAASWLGNAALQTEMTFAARGGLQISPELARVSAAPAERYGRGGAPDAWLALASGAGPPNEKVVAAPIARRKFLLELTSFLATAVFARAQTASP